MKTHFTLYKASLQDRLRLWIQYLAPYALVSILTIGLMYGFVKSGKPPESQTITIIPDTLYTIAPRNTNQKTRIPVTSTPATNFIKRFTKIAQTEQKKFGIPASIKLAQALLETTKGTSKLFRNHNNAFGIKCFSKTCKVGHCTNLSDDHHKDFFRIYDNAWESFRDHSIKLQGNRYKHLLSIPATYYKAWAKGLQKAGYATDKRYTVNLFFPALLCNSLVPASRLTAIL